MTAQKCSVLLKVTSETLSPRLLIELAEIKNSIMALESFGSATRQNVAAIIREHDLAAYIGSNHIAIHRKNADGYLIGARVGIVMAETNGEWPNA